MDKMSVYSISEENAAGNRRAIRRHIVIIAGLALAYAVLFYWRHQIMTSSPGGWVSIAMELLMILLFSGACYALMLLVRWAGLTRRVQLHEKGLDIFKVIGKQSLSYDDIKKAELLDDSAQSSRRHLKLSLKSAKNKELGHIKDEIENFDQLTAELRQMIGQEPEPGLSAEQADRRARLRQRDERLRRWLMLSALLLLFLMGTIALMLSAHEIKNELRENGLRTEAVVVKHYFDDDASRMIRYQYSDQDGRKHIGETSAPKDLWAGISEGDSLPVAYLPNAPGTAFLPFEEEDMSRLDLYIGLLLVFAFLSAAMCVLSLAGCELEYLNGKFYWVKRGELVEDKLN